MASSAPSSKPLHSHSSHFQCAAYENFNCIHLAIRARPTTERSPDKIRDVSVPRDPAFNRVSESHGTCQQPTSHKESKPLMLRPSISISSSYSPSPLAAIPEEAPDYFEDATSSSLFEYEEYTLDLGSGLAESTCPTPTPSYLKRPQRPSPSSSASNLRRRSTHREKDAERDCGICFEPASSPIRTLCLAPGPRSGRALSCCRAMCSFAFGEETLPRKGLLALGHPSLLLIVPRTPPPSRSASPSCLVYSESSAGSYASYPTSPSSSSVDPTLESEEDSTDYSLPAVRRARALQTRRHTSHPSSSVPGARAAIVRVLCVAGWLVVVAVLAGRGRWA
ncbi:hypothetical protein C8R44DRAFT_849376 [Mycena epipterygia]|nr:hypothetical protein C8R44DRAFT_849376 [Mycena epipterygia]